MVLAHAQAAWKDHEDRAQDVQNLAQLLLPVDSIAKPIATCAVDGDY